MIALLRIAKYGFQGFRRNLWLSIIAIVTMALTLTTITVALMADVVVARQIQEFNSKIDYIIFLKDEPADVDVQSFVDQIAKRPEVASRAYLDKEAVRLKFEQRLGQIEALKGIITADNNPLPREIDVKFGSPNQVESFDTFVRQERFQTLIESTSYRSNKVLIDQYQRASQLVKIAGSLLSIFFAAVSVLVILNTIRLAIFARREEIQVMRLVGATASYIRGPFLIEGALFGAVGALLSGLIFWVLLHQVQQVLQQNISEGTSNYITELLGPTFQSITNATGFTSLTSQVVLLQVFTGILLGVTCSILSAHRYLRER